MSSINVLSWIEHLFGISPTKPAAVNYAQVVTDVTTAVNAIIPVAQSAVVGGVVTGPAAASIASVIPKVQAAVAELGQTVSPTTVNGVLSDLHLLVTFLPPQYQVPANVALTIAGATLTSFLGSGSPAVAVSSAPSPSAAATTAPAA